MRTLTQHRLQHRLQRPRSHDPNPPPGMPLATIAGVVLSLSLLPLLGCSSLPLLPDGANLATVDYVNDADEQNLEQELPSAIDSALVDDRKQIAQLQQRVLAQESQLEESRQQVDELSKTLDQLSEDMRVQAETFRTLAGRLEETASGLDQALSALPTDTLRLFSDALQEYLAAVSPPPEADAAPEAPGVESAGSETTEGG